MSIEMVLNELSLAVAATDRLDARRRMTGLVGTIRQATAIGVSRVLRTHRDINLVELAPGYRLSAWRNDDSVRREEQTFFRSLDKVQNGGSAA